MREPLFSKPRSQRCWFEALRHSDARCEIASCRFGFETFPEVMTVQILITMSGELSRYSIGAQFILSTPTSASSTSSSCPTPSSVSSSSMIASLDTTTSAPTRWLVLLLILDQIDDLVRYSQVFDLPRGLATSRMSHQRRGCYYIIASHVDLW